MTQIVQEPHPGQGSARERFVTISVDDGHPTDLRTVDLLRRYGLKATFYVPGSNHERTLLPASQIREIDREFEVGSHSLHHVRLTTMPVEKALQDILDGKKCSEDMLGHEVISFCYPGGKFNSRLARQVAEAGFLAGRTCRYFVNDFPKNPFYWDVSTYANTFPAYVQIRHCLLERNFSGAYNYMTKFQARTPWASQFRRALKYVSENAGIAHLYLHSWEIDQNGEWDELENLFKAVGQYSLTSVTNGYLFRLWHEKRGLVHSAPPALSALHR